MKYLINFYSLSATTINSSNITPSIIAGYEFDGSCDVFILGLTVNRTMMSFSSPGSVKLVGINKNSPKTNQLVTETSIQSGDLIQIFENTILIFTGYVLKTRYSYSASGQILDITFDTLLSQFSRQNMIQSFNDVQTLTPIGTGEQIDVSNRVGFSNLLSYMQQGSIYNFASKLPVGKNTESYGVVYTSPQWLTGSSNIFYYPSTQSTKEQVLLSSVFLYQVMIYQDADGSIIVGTPSAQNTSGIVIPLQNNINLRSYELIHNEAELINNIVVSLYYAGFFPSTASNNGSNLVSLAIPDPNDFPRSNFLYTSQFFSQVKLIVDSLQGNILSDPTLLELATSTLHSGTNTSIPSNVNKNAPTSVPLLAARYLAQALTYSSYITVEVERNEQLPQIPIDQVITVDGNPWYCVSATIDLKAYGSNNVQNKMQLIGVPLYSITGGWS